MKKNIFMIVLLSTLLLSAAPVKVSTFGFDKTNATKCIQAALDSEHRDLIIDNTGSSIRSSCGAIKTSSLMKMWLSGRVTMDFTA